MKDPIVRAQVLDTGISLRDMLVNMYDKNPYLHPGKEDVETTRLYVRNIPLSYDNDVITDYLKNIGLDMLNMLGPEPQRGNLQVLRPETDLLKLWSLMNPFQRRKHSLLVLQGTKTNNK